MRNVRVTLRHCKKMHNALIERDAQIAELRDKVYTLTATAEGYKAERDTRIEECERMDAQIAELRAELERQVDGQKQAQSHWGVRRRRLKAEITELQAELADAENLSCARSSELRDIKRSTSFKHLESLQEEIAELWERVEDAAIMLLGAEIITISRAAELMNRKVADVRGILLNDKRCHDIYRAAGQQAATRLAEKGGDVEDSTP